MKQHEHLPGIAGIVTQGRCRGDVGHTAEGALGRVRPRHIPAEGGSLPIINVGRAGSGRGLTSRIRKKLTDLFVESGYLSVEDTTTR